MPFKAKKFANILGWPKFKLSQLGHQWGPVSISASTEVWLGQDRDAFARVFTHWRQVELAENQKQISRQRLGHMLEGKPNKPGPRLQSRVFAENGMTKLNGSDQTETS